MSRRVFWLVLVCAFGLRVWLATGGGQGYWPDELMRYGEARNAAYHLANGHWQQALPDLFGRADHQLFRWMALVPATFDVWWGSNPWRTACWFSLFSVGCIGLVGCIARRSGAGAPEQLFATVLAAGSTTLFFYSRHYLPYDAALFFLLLAVVVGDGSGNWKRSVVAGCCAGVAFLTYNGYWLGTVAVGLIHFLREGSWDVRWRRGMWMAAGMIFPIVTMIGVARILRFDLVALYRANAGSITQGDFGLGWRVIVEYLWHAEHGVAVLWLIATVGATVAMARRTLAPRAICWLGAVALILSGLFVFSDLVARFVVYGRLVRQVVPFLCLLTGHMLWRWVGAKPGRIWEAGVAVLLALLALPNIFAPLQQEFPREFESRAWARARAFQQNEFGVFAVQNVEHLWAKTPALVPPGATVIRRRAHPLQYAPYLYEGFSAEQRRELLRDDRAAMRLVNLAPLFLGADSIERIAREGRLFPLQFEVKLPKAVPGRAEPLITWGTPGKGDFLFVRDVADDKITIGLDHWGGKLVESQPVPIDRAETLSVIVSCPAFYPAGRAQSDELIKELRRELLVIVNGRTVLCRPVIMHDAELRDTMVGWNFIGGSTTATKFTGTIERILPVQMTEFTRLLPRLAPLRRDEPGWEGTPGPFEITLEVPDAHREQRQPQPLAASGRDRTGDLLYCALDEEGRLSFSLWHGGQMRHAPEPLPVKAGQRVRLSISLGSYWPGADAEIYRGKAAAGSWRRRLRVFVDERAIWDEPMDFFPTQNSWTIACHDLPADDIPNRTSWNCVEVQPWRGPGVLGADSVHFSQHPGSLRLRVLMPVGREGATEPLVTTGVRGGADFLFLRYESGNRFRVGFDHWGAGGPLSEPISYDPGVPIEFVVSLGSLHTPRSEVWRQRLWVAVDGRTIFDYIADFHPSAPDQIQIGRNSLGGSSTGAEFTGDVLSQQSVAIDADATPRELGR